jgi:hypothetical protein
MLIYMYITFPCASANALTVRYAVANVYIPHASVGLVQWLVSHRLHTYRHYILLEDDAYLSVRSRFVCLPMLQQLSHHHPSLYSTTFQSEFPFKVTRHSFSIRSDITTAIYGLRM